MKVTGFVREVRHEGHAVAFVEVVEPHCCAGTELQLPANGLREGDAVEIEVKLAPAQPHPPEPDHYLTAEEIDAAADPWEVP